MKRKFKMALLLVTIIGTIGLPVHAAEETKNIEVIREDVPHEIAVLDDSYDENVAMQNMEMNNVVDRAVSWHAWGEREYQLLGRQNMARAVGHSEQVNDGWVTSTYHYTRTFFGETALTATGDSGRVWGQYTVTARGTWIYQYIADEHVLKVFYGTED